MSLRDGSAVQQAHIYRAQRFEERAKQLKRKKIREEKEKEKRRLKREADALAKKELLEKQRLAREAGEPIPVSLEEEEEEEDLDAKFALPEEFQKYTQAARWIDPVSFDGKRNVKKRNATSPSNAERTKRKS